MKIPTAFAAIVTVAVVGCTVFAEPAVTKKVERKDKVVKSDKEWSEILSEKQFYILREKGTERAFTGEYWDSKTVGTYKCAGCGLPLFSSEAKFKSGTGWPSFWQPVGEKSVSTESDTTFGMVRTEVLCARCGGHLGHIFKDGPKPTGLRYCINSAALVLEPVVMEKAAKVKTKKK